MARVRFNAQQECITGKRSHGSGCLCPELDGYICDEHDPVVLDSVHRGCFCTWEFMCEVFPIVKEA